MFGGFLMPFVTDEANIGPVISPYRIWVTESGMGYHAAFFLFIPPYPFR